MANIIFIEISYKITESCKSDCAVPLPSSYSSLNEGDSCLSHFWMLSLVLNLEKMFQFLLPRLVSAYLKTSFLCSTPFLMKEMETFLPIQFYMISFIILCTSVVWMKLSSLRLRGTWNWFSAIIQSIYKQLDPINSAGTYIHSHIHTHTDTHWR